MTSAASAGLALCRSCHLLQPCQPKMRVICARCGAEVVLREPSSIMRSWFFLTLAVLMLVPANTLPIMNILMFNRGDPSTIIGGVALLIHHHIYGIAFVVFFASFVVPLSKVCIILILLLSVQYNWKMSRPHRMKMFRLVEFMGRWSMLDVFVVAVMVGLVHLGQVVTVLPGAGAVVFGAAVVLTMLASMSFDPRLIWDAADTQDDSVPVAIVPVDTVQQVECPPS